MRLHEEIQQLFTPFPAECSEKKGVVTVRCVVAERKTFLSRKKLVYTAQYRIDEYKREVRFTEALKESGFGIAGGSDFDNNPGIGFKKETYRTGDGAREGIIEVQSNLFANKYTYTFDFKKIRAGIEKKALEAGYSFSYQITSLGL